MAQYTTGTNMNYPTCLKIVDYKINFKQFGFAGLPNLTESYFAKQLNNRIIEELNTKHHMNVNKLKKYICEYGKEFQKDAIAKELNLTQEEVNYINEEMKNFGWKAAPKKKE